MSSQRKFPAVFAGAENGFIAREFCFVVQQGTKQSRFAQEDAGRPDWFIGRDEIKCRIEGEPGRLAGPPRAG
jgi:hypothetical protein